MPRCRRHRRVGDNAGDHRLALAGRVPSASSRRMAARSTGQPASKLRRDGLGASDIARKLKIGRASVYRIMRHDSGRDDAEFTAGEPTAIAAPAALSPLLTYFSANAVQRRATAVAAQLAYLVAMLPTTACAPDCISSRSMRLVCRLPNLSLRWVSIALTRLCVAACFAANSLSRPSRVNPTSRRRQLRPGGVNHFPWWSWWRLLLPRGRTCRRAP